MPENRTFNSYYELFKLIALAREEENKNGNAKCYSSLRTEEKESIIYTNTQNINNYKQKVLIYNQALKLRETSAKSYTKTLEKYPELESRMRIEVSFKEKYEIFHFQKLSIDISEIKRKYIFYLANNIFNPSRIRKYIEKQISSFAEELKSKYSKNIIWNEAAMKVKNNPKAVFSEEVFKGAIKNLNLTERGKENARRKIREIAVKDSIPYTNISKDLNSIGNYICNERSGQVTDKDEKLSILS